MKHSRLLALILALAMAFALAGCGSDAAGSASSASASGSAAPAASGSAESAAEPAAGIPAEAEADVVSYLTDGALAATDVVATVGGTEITAAELLYMVAYNHYQLSYNSYYYNGAALDLTADTGDGVTVSDFIFNTSMDSMVAYAVAMNKAIADGIALTEEDAAALADLHAQNVTAHGESQWSSYVSAGLINEEEFSEEEKAAWIQEHGEALYRHSMMYYGTTEEAYQQVYTTFYYFNTLMDALFGEGGSSAPTEETIADYLQTYITDNGLLWGRCILFSTMDCTTDEERAEVKAQADEVYAQLSALSGDELSQAFTDLQSQYDGSGYTPGEVQQYATTDSLVDGYYSGLEALEPGQIAMTEELGTEAKSYGYFILLREENDTEGIRATVENAYIENTFDSMIAQWRDETDVSYSDAYNALNRLTVFERLSTLQNALYTADSVG